MIKPGLYRHFKGMQYLVEHVARHSETMEPFVVYQALYGDFGHWIRPLAMFKESVMMSGEEIPRFQWVADLATAQSLLASKQAELVQDTER